MLLVYIFVIFQGKPQVFHDLLSFVVFI